MADSYWSGLGISAGTDVTDVNDSTPGNMVLGDAGHGVQAFVVISAGSVFQYARPADPAGNGFTTTGVATDTCRLNLTANTARGMAVQIRYTPSATPSVDFELITGRTGDDAGFGGVNVLHLTTGILRFRTNGIASLATSPALTLGHTYQIDAAADLNPGTPSTTNGRGIFRVIDLSDSTWNTTGEYFYDSGYATNVGTAQVGRWRVGKNGSTSVFGQAYITEIYWGERVAMDTSTDPAIARAQLVATTGGYNPPTDIPPNILVDPASVGHPIVAVTGR